MVDPEKSDREPDISSAPPGSPFVTTRQFLEWIMDERFDKLEEEIKGLGEKIGNVENIVTERKTADELLKTFEDDQKERRASIRENIKMISIIIGIIAALVTLIPNLDDIIIAWNNPISETSETTNKLENEGHN